MNDNKNKINNIIKMNILKNALDKGWTIEKKNNNTFLLKNNNLTNKLNHQTNFENIIDSILDISKFTNFDNSIDLNYEI